MHEEVSERLQLPYDYRKLIDMQHQLQLKIDDLPDFPKIRSIYSLKHNETTRRNRPINIAKVVNESQNPPTSYSDLQSCSQVETLSAKRLRDGEVIIQCSYTKPVIIKISKDTEKITYIFPNSRVPPKIHSLDIANPNVDPEPSKPTPGVKDTLAYANNSIEVKDTVKINIKENKFDDVCLTLGTELNHDDSQPTTYPDKNLDVSVKEESFAVPIPYCAVVEGSEFVAHKSTSANEVTSFKAASSKNINVLCQNIPPVCETNKKSIDKDAFCTTLGASLNHGYTIAHKTIIECPLDELKNINSYEKSNDNETLLKTGNMSSTLIVDHAEKEVISNNVSTPNSTLNFGMIDSTQMNNDNLYTSFIAPLNQEFEMASTAPTSNELIEDKMEWNEKFGFLDRASCQKKLMQSIPLSSDIIESEVVTSFCVPPSTYNKESSVSSLNCLEISPIQNSQPEITYADTNVIFPKCNIVEIEVKTSPESKKINRKRSKTTLLNNSLVTNIKRSRKPSTFKCCIIDEVNSDEKLPLVGPEEYSEWEKNVSDSEDETKKLKCSIPKKAATQNTRKRRRKSKLTVTKRRKLSVAKASSTSSTVESIFKDLERIKFSIQNFKKNVDYFVKALLNPEHSLDTAHLIFHVIEYLCGTCRNPMLNQDDQSDSFCDHISNLLPITEDYIVSILFKIEKRMRKFQSLVHSTVTTLYNMVFGKEFVFPLYGLASLCRVLTEICKQLNNKRIPLQLCGELLKWQHQYAPYLIASVVSIWQEIFQPSSNTDKDETIFLSAIACGVKNKPEKLSDSEWQQCQVIFSNLLPVKAIEDKQIPKEVCVLLNGLAGKFLEFDYEKDFFLTTALVIYSQVKGWEWTSKCLIETFIKGWLKKYSNEMKYKKAFEYFINLYAEIRFNCPDKEDPYGLLKVYFEADTDYVNFTAAIALLKLIIWKGEYFSKEILQWLDKWNEQDKVISLYSLFKRRYMKEKVLSISDIIDEE